jgi:MFS family permease
LSQQEEQRSLIERLRSEFGFIEGNFLIMVFSWLILDLFTELPGTYYPLYVQALGATATSIGLIGSVEMLAAALVQIPGGYLTDKYGRKWLISSMTFIAALARVFYVYAPSWEWILVGALIVGVCRIYQPALNAIVADSLPREKRGMGFSIINLIASVSTTPAPLIAGYLFTLYGLVPSMRLIYKLVIFGFLVAALLRTRLTETIENPEKINPRELVSAYPVSMRESLNVWKLVPRAAFVLFLVDIISSFTSGLFQPIITLYIVHDLGIGEVQLSYIMTALPVSMILLALPSGKVIDIVGKKKPILAAYILWAAAILLLVYGNFTRLIIAFILVGTLMILMNSAISSLEAGLVPKEHRGKVAGSRGFFRLIAAALGQLTGGWLYDSVNHKVPFLIQIGLVLIPMAMVYLWIDEDQETIH